MLILPQKVKVKWNSKIKKHYVDKGYIFTKMGEEFEVNVIDLTKGSRVEIKVQCDYCGKIISKDYYSYINQNNNSIIHKDCCENCSPLKVKESNLLIYGVSYIFDVLEYKEKRDNAILDKYDCENVFQNEEIKNKIKQTCMEKYGAEHPMKTKKFQEQFEETCLKKYGVRRPLQNEIIKNNREQTYLNNWGVKNPNQVKEIRDKIESTCMEKYNVNNPMKNDKIKAKLKKNMYLNGTMPCSSQQKYLGDLFGGEINYPIDYCTVDIALIDKNIYIEYNGSGHDIPVKYNKLTQDEFDRKQRRRYHFLRSSGWKIIEIFSNKDYLPEDDILYNMLFESIEYLDSGHNWIIFDIDNSTVRCSQFDKKYNFGILRKVNKKEVL